MTRLEAIKKRFNRAEPMTFYAVDSGHHCAEFINNAWEDMQLLLEVVEECKNAREAYWIADEGNETCRLLDKALAKLEEER
jgi:hypothetical protein